MAARVALAVGIVVALAAAAWSLVPFDEGSSSCNAAVTQAWERTEATTATGSRAVLLEYQGRSLEIPPQPTPCAQAAQTRLTTSGVIVGLAAVGTTAVVLVLRRPSEPSEPGPDRTPVDA